ncbi:MAG: carbohydrate-binding domain-containing protein [Prevotella sp.]|nr:carbohydrate-binding domain-containing protein [Prevotella sp.]
MKKTIVAVFSLLLTVVATAQTLNITVSGVTYQFPSTQTGDMAFSDGTTLTVMNKAFTLSEVSSITVDDTSVTDNLVSIVYSTSDKATVTVAGNVAQYVTASIDGNHVTITPTNTDAVDNDEITYQLSGTSTNGSLTLSGSYKCTVSLAGVTLTNTSGAAINITNSKRIQLSAKSGYTNTLTDGSGSQKACIFSKGQLQLQGKGTLNVVGNCNHAIRSASYISIKNLTLNITSSVKDAINCEEYFLMKSGSVTLSGVGDDGIQCDLGSKNTGVTDDHEDEDTGNMYFEGGTLTINNTATAAKGIKAEGDIIVSDGTIDVTCSGSGKWDSSDLETKAASCISSDANITISGGTLSLTATGSGGKGMKCDDTLTITDGNVTVVTSGGLYYNNGSTENTNYTGNTDNIDNSYYSSPKGIKAGIKDTSTSTTTYSGNLVISGGTVSVTTSGYNAEGIESKNTLYITGGTVTINSYDDGINSAQEMYLQGGTISVTASNNDGIDSNANMYISGGTVIACGASGAECGLDVAEGCSLYITGGNVLALGGSNNAVSSTNGSQCVLSTSGSASAGSTVSVKSGSSTLASFTIPSTYSSSNGKSNAPGGGNQGGMGGNSGSNILISCSGLTSGNSYTVTVGSSSSNVTASTTTSNSMH